MISKETTERLQQLPNTPYGAALKEFLLDEYEKIGDIRSAKSWEETIGRQLSLDTLDRLFKFMGEIKKTKVNNNEYQ